MFEIISVIKNKNSSRNDIYDIHYLVKEIDEYHITYFYLEDEIKFTDYPKDKNFNGMKFKEKIRKIIKMMGW